MLHPIFTPALYADALVSKAELHEVPLTTAYMAESETLGMSELISGGLFVTSSYGTATF